MTKTWLVSFHNVRILEFGTAEMVERLLPVESVPLPEWTEGTWVDLILHRQGKVWQWQGEFHPRGPQVGGGFSSWLPYKEAVEGSEPQV